MNHHLIKIIFALFILFHQVTGFGQSKNRPLLKNLAHLRTQVLVSEESNLIYLDSLYHHWEPIVHLDLNDKVNALYNIAYYHNALYYDKDKMHRLPELIKHGFRETEIDRETIRKLDKCLNVLSLMSDGFISPEMPFRINLDSTFGVAMDFYEFQQQELVADIGAGIGTDIWALSYLYPKNRFIATEMFLGPDTYLANRFLNISNVEFKRAKKKHTNLEGRDINRILIQSTFHHFKEKDLMIQSIKKSLSPDGIVILKEATYDQAGHEYCGLSMRLEDIKWYWSKNGFQLIDELVIGKTTYLKYQL